MLTTGSVRRCRCAALAAVSCLLLTLLAGCAVTPEPLTDAHMREQAAADTARLSTGQAPIDGPVDVYEAMARSLAYNLDLRVELMNQALAGAELELARLDMLPRLIGQLDYSARDEFNAASSQPLSARSDAIDRPSFSSQRDVLTGDLRLSWNVLDFGVSYYRAKQAGDRALIAAEQTQRVINRILEDVRTAFWRAVSDQRLRLRLGTLLREVEQSLNETEAVKRRKLRSPLAALTAKRELLGVRRELLSLRRELALGKLQLAALMNLRPGEPFEVLVPEALPAPKAISTDRAVLEQLALVSRPELRENALRKRINANEARAALLQLLPGLELNAGIGYSSNDFLVNNDWLSVGASVTGNLMEVLRYGPRKEELAARDAVLDAEGLALSMAVLTQVNVSLAQHVNAIGEYDNAVEYNDTQAELTSVVRSREQAQRVSRQVLIREEMNALVAQVQRDVAFASVENAYAAVMAAIGSSPLPDGVTSATIDELAFALRQHWR